MLTRGGSRRALALQKPLTVALLGLTEGNGPLREALRASGLLLEGDTGASGMVAAVIDLGARDRDELIALARRSEEHTSELQSLAYLVCRLLLEKKKKHEQKQL